MKPETTDESRGGRAARALEAFSCGRCFNCAQSVLSSFCEDYGCARETALKLASGLGAGLRAGEVCGAVSGAVLVIGLKYGQTAPEDIPAKRECYGKTEEFTRRFAAKHGALACRDLLGCDISAPEGRERALELRLFETACVDLVASSVMMLEELGY